MSHLVDTAEMYLKAVYEQLSATDTTLAGNLRGTSSTYTQAEANNTDLAQAV